VKLFQPAPPAPKGAIQNAGGVNFLFSAWKPRGLTAGAVVQSPANFGTDGFLLPFQIRPVRQSSDIPNPHVPVFNDLVAIQWKEYVLSPEEVATLTQAGMVVGMATAQLPMTFTGASTTPSVGPPTTYDMSQA
jgi:hypothetical protein